MLVYSRIFVFFSFYGGGGVAKDNDEQFEIDVINMLSSSFDFFKVLNLIDAHLRLNFPTNPFKNLQVPFPCAKSIIQSLS